jgi:cytochrome oxidase Cu insertion factor (SCO1/SenC/PrrC family)/thiol-disulfide isomerase/thioredoxin
VRGGAGGLRGRAVPAVDVDRVALDGRPGFRPGGPRRGWVRVGLRGWARRLARLGGVSDRPDRADGAEAPARRRHTALVAGSAFVVGAVIVALALVIGPPGGANRAPGAASALQANPDVDPGTAISAPAANFTLTDQFGRAVSLRSLRGHVVVLAFTDSQCTTVCPLTSASMVDAKALLGSAGKNVELIGIDANPTATAVKWVRAYSAVHGLLDQWRFLTGSLRALRRVWSAYHILVQVQAGQIDHTPALFVIDARGRLAEIYETQMAYSSVPQQAQILAREISSLLPGHPRVRSSLSYATVATVGPATDARLPRAGGGSVTVGPNGAPRLYLFFASWLRETQNLPGELESLRAYAAAAAARGLPGLTAIDEGSVEPSAQALPRLLAGLPARLNYPVAIDQTGRVADGYEVQDQPWLVLVSRDGQVLWYWDGSTQGWLDLAQLIAHVRDALAAGPTLKAPSASEAPIALAGSPAPLSALHRQASRLLGGEGALAARIRDLRGYPIVINAWAPWCTACRAEYRYLASAAVQYGRRVAFIGVDALDSSPSDARGWLAAHPLSYPSYTSLTGAMPIGPGIYALPTTIFVNATGKVTCVVPGQYDSQGELDGQVQSCALDGQPAS